MYNWTDNYTTSDMVAEPQIDHNECRSWVVQRPLWSIQESSSASIRFSRGPKLFRNMRILRLLKEYESLNENWAGDDSPIPSQNAISSARSLTFLLSQFGQPIYHAVPGPNGEIMMDIRDEQRNKSIEIIFYPNRSVVVLFPEQGSPFQNIFLTENLPTLLHWLNN